VVRSHNAGDGSHIWKVAVNILNK